MSELILFEKYRVIKVISKSEYSTVYLVLHIRLQCYRIIKKIYKASPCYEQLIREARVMKLLKHPCIPQIYDIEEDDGSFYIVEQFMEGESLKEICQTIKLQEKTILSYAIQICDLIQFLHSREQAILYLDLKPDNILINNGQVYLVDFGSSNHRASPSDFMFGTPWFASPEQYLTKHLDERADIYGIGMLLYYMILGKDYALEKGKNIDFSNSCSKGLKRIVNRCLRMQAFQRYTSIKELHKSLSDIQNNLKKNINTEHITSIAIAGAMHRIGVTHIALQMANFLKLYNISCSYLECNENLDLFAIARRTSMKNYREEGYYLYEIPCFHRDTIRDLMVESQYKIIIKDYGVLNEDNYEDFIKADRSIVVLGAKQWELDDAERCIELCKRNEDIFYLFNFTSALDFQVVVKNMKRKKCLRVPYEPRIVLYNKTAVMEELFFQILQDFL